MDKKKIKKEFEEFLDSASDETIRDFLKFIKKRKEKKEVLKDNTGITATINGSLN